MFGDERGRLMCFGKTGAWGLGLNCVWGHARGPRVRVTSRASDGTRYIIVDPACTRRARDDETFLSRSKPWFNKTDRQGCLAGVAWLFGFLAFWLFGFLAFWLFGFLAFWFFGFLAFWFFGFLAFLATRPTGRGVFWREWLGLAFCDFWLLWLFWLFGIFIFWLFGFLAFWACCFGFLASWLFGFCWGMGLGVGAGMGGPGRPRVRF